MTDAALPLITLAAAARYLADHGVARERSSLLRFVETRPHLIRSWRNAAAKTGPLVNGAELLAAYSADYTRQLHSGEATGARDPATPRPANDGAPSAPRPPPDAAEDPAKQKIREDVRKRRRENEIAEGQLAPVSEIYAVLADIVPEIQQAFARIRQKHAEKLAADLRQPDLAVTISAALQDFEAAALNRLAARMAERAAGADAAALARFLRLTELAAELQAAPAPQAAATA